MSTAAATRMSPLPAKGPKASGRRRHHYRVNTRCSPYYHRTTGRRHGSKKMPSGWTAACGGVGVAVCIAARGESKVNIMGGPTAMTADSAVIAVRPPITGRIHCAVGTSKHRLNLARQIVEMATRIDRRFLAKSDPLPQMLEMSV